MFQCSVNVETSFFEIYNEKIHDLLAFNKVSSSSKQNVCILDKLFLSLYVITNTYYGTVCHMVGNIVCDHVMYICKTPYMIM